MKKIKISIILLSIIIFIFSIIKISQAYTTIPTICFDGNKKEISFINDSNGDLFNNLKDIMPGDIREQEILLKLENMNNEIKIFLKIEEDELPKGVNIETFLENQKLEKKEDYIILGTFNKNQEIKLKVKLEVAKEVGNELQDLERNIKWDILIQENPEENNTNGEMDKNDLTQVPYTYDNSRIEIYIILCLISLIGIIITSFKLKERK